MSCVQIDVTNGGSASPTTVPFPGAYKARFRFFSKTWGVDDNFVGKRPWDYHQYLRPCPYLSKLLLNWIWMQTNSSSTVHFPWPRGKLYVAFVGIRVTFCSGFQRMSKKSAETKIPCNCNITTIEFLRTRHHLECSGVKILQPKFAPATSFQH